MGEQIPENIRAAARGVVVRFLNDQISSPYHYVERAATEYLNLSKNDQDLVDKKISTFLSREFAGADLITDRLARSYLETRITERVSELRDHFAAPERLADLAREG